MNSDKMLRKANSKQSTSRIYELNNLNSNLGLGDDYKNHTDQMSNSNRVNLGHTANFIENSVEENTVHKVDDTIDVENHLNSSTEKIR